MGSTPAGWPTLFLHIGVFGLVTFCIYLACMLMVRLEAKRVAARDSRRTS